MSKRRLTEKELLETQRLQLLYLDFGANKAGFTLEQIEDDLPCWLHYNEQIDATPDEVIEGEFISLDVTDQSSKPFGDFHFNKAGCNFVKLSKEEAAKGGIDFMVKYADLNEHLKLLPMHAALFFNKDESDVRSFFHKMRPGLNKPFEWIFSSAKYYADKKTLLSISSPVKQIDEIGHKLNRVLDENVYMKKHLHLFSSLTKREKEIITLIVSGYNNPQIAETLFIARSTVEQHRKNINRKLEIKTFAQLMKFALAFDLV